MTNARKQQKTDLGRAMDVVLDAKKRLQRATASGAVGVIAKAERRLALAWEAYARVHVRHPQPAGPVRRTQVARGRVPGSAQTPTAPRSKGGAATKQRRSRTVPGGGDLDRSAPPPDDPLGDAAPRGLIHSQDPDAAQRLVWAFPRARSFHRRDCFVIETRDGAVTVPVADARKRGLERCEHCAPSVR